MSGYITTSHLVLNGLTIIQVFGVRVYIQAWRLSLKRDKKPHTFLEASMMG